MIRIAETAFDPSAELAGFIESCGSDLGGIASFIGLVRGNHGDARVDALTLEHYPGMTEAKLREFEETAKTRWPVSHSLVIHRVGRMLPGDAIVLVATASAHRQAALDACAFLIDILKTQAPFWKYEERDDGAHWVEARASDSAAAQRWVAE
jgi:molybdopterin synthase catalytic subunit